MELQPSLARSLEVIAPPREETRDQQAAEPKTGNVDKNHFSLSYDPENVSHHCPLFCGMEARAKKV